MFFGKKQQFRSKLFTQIDFYEGFIRDLKSCKKEIIIESPYITASRMERLYPIFEKLLSRSIYIHIITREPIEHEDEYMRDQTTNEILYCRELGINTVLLTGYHHRKIAIIDRSILWEGSLNILSYNNSQEIMRRIESKESAQEMLRFLKINEFI